jgi:hypothetical protein
VLPAFPSEFDEPLSIIHAQVAAKFAYAKGSHRVVVVDGTDGIMQTLPLDAQRLYFKRENTGHQKAFPISFSIPKTKIRDHLLPKEQGFSVYQPGQIYMYDSEDEYYRDYAISTFGTTRRKAGWDCLRHYEIMAQGCIPYFYDIELCPEHTCTTLPKLLLQFARKHCFSFINSQRGYDLCELMLHHVRTYCTTEAEAKRFLSVLRNVTRGLI